MNRILMSFRDSFFVERRALSVVRIGRNSLRTAHCALRKTKKGFTLLEIMLAMVLFGTGIVGIAGLFGSSLDNSLDAEYTETAVTLAQARMEEIRNYTYDSIPADPKAQVTGFPLFQRQVELDKDMLPALPDLKQVTVTVYWQFKGQEVKVLLDTYVSKN